MDKTVLAAEDTIAPNVTTFVITNEA
jgi:hypothetical protein